PELLYKSACEYFSWCEQNPLIEIDFVGKDATKVEKPKMRPFTWEGLELYLGIHRLRHYRSDESYKDFWPTLARIYDIIYNQKFTGAAAGFLNQNIIARDLGLADKKDVENSGEMTIKFIEEKTYETVHKADPGD
ncbi:terminase small subunit, partial [Arachidicoccus sp.]|uniref:terminase small subunit n=1 Tax=Arachidicoccus sp. TaxID=1872624 RepID=UPI003D21918B